MKCHFVILYSGDSGTTRVLKLKTEFYHIHTFFICPTQKNATFYLSNDDIISAVVPVESAWFPPCNLPSFCFAVNQLSLLKLICYLIKIS